MYSVIVFRQSKAAIPNFFHVVYKPKLCLEPEFSTSNLVSVNFWRFQTNDLPKFFNVELELRVSR